MCHHDDVAPVVTQQLAVHNVAHQQSAVAMIFLPFLRAFNVVLTAS
jgi:hypothetical protein